MRPLILTALLLLALTGCGGDDEAGANPKKPTVDLQAAVDGCNETVQTSLDTAANTANGGAQLTPDVVMRVGDSGKSLDVSPEHVVPFLVQPSVDAAVCVMEKTKAPDSVRSEVGQVSGMDGRQQASWDGVALTYSYDANTGFTGVFTATE